MELALAKNLSVPLDAVTQTFGFMGKKGSGKTYLAGLMAEQMLDRHAQIIVIDPVGNWYGLRVGADGKSKGKDIFIVGGEHGDVPILPDAGERLAKLLVEKQISVILDISGFRQGERRRFAADFAEEFYHLKKTQKSAVHLFVEEAQLFAPQQFKGQERMLGAFENIIRLGRNYGIGASMISQRPQSVNKEVLNQVECLFVLQVNGVQEREALDKWVQEAGADRSLVGQLPGLTQGEGYVWSPSWLRIFARFHFGTKTTFDASATPTVGQKRQAAKLTPIDVAALKVDMQQVIEKAEADDPNALRRQISELKRQLATKQPTGKIERIDHDKLAEAQKAELTKILDNNFKKIQDQFLKHIRDSLACVQGAESILSRMHDSVLAGSWSIDLTSQAKHIIKSAVVTTPLAQKALPRNNAITAPRPRPTAESNGNLGKGERAILSVLAQHGTKSKNFVAAVAGYSVTAGGFGNLLSRLRTLGYLAGSNPIEITQEGLAVLGAWDPTPSGIELLEFWKSKLGKAERLILGALAESDLEMTRDELAEAAGYEPTGGGFGNSLSRLRTLELIEGSGTIQLNRDFAEALSQ